MSTSWTPGSQPSIFTFREELDEVSNRRLTSMALDIARGLAYLADLKYVHRYVHTVCTVVFETSINRNSAENVLQTINISQK